MEITQDPRVPEKFTAYPEGIRTHLEALRKLILESAEEAGIKKIEETLKWGEPSYLNSKGSTIRIDWKEKSPERFAIFFICSTSLVETFRKVYPEVVQYENNRALWFNLHEDLPKNELKNCLKAALEYKIRKDQPLLGLYAQHKAIPTQLVDLLRKLLPQQPHRIQVPNKS